jgi:hypothetical protein
VIRLRRMRLAGHIACMGKERNNKVSVRKSEGKRPVERPRHTWEDNTYTYLLKIMCKNVY